MDMLSVDSRNYHEPQWDERQQSWILRSKRNDSEALTAVSFNYTLREGDDRMTFTYVGKSVKPAARTLRIYGNEFIKSYVSRLARLRVPEVTQVDSDSRESKEKKKEPSLLRKFIEKSVSDSVLD